LYKAVLEFLIERVDSLQVQSDFRRMGKWYLQDKFDEAAGD